MQKWEYTFVDCEDKNNAWRPRYVNHQEVGDWENGTTMIEFSNHLGEQGWELASSNLAMGFMWAEFKPLAIRMIFKRPKS